MIDFPPINKSIMIFVKTLINQTHAIEMDYEDSVEILKERVAMVSKVPSYKQRLIFKGFELRDGQPCLDVEDFSKEGTIHLVILK